MIVTLGRELARLVYPRVCPICRETLINDRRYPCSGCQEALPRVAKPWCLGCGGTLDGVAELCLECTRYERPWRLGVTVFEYCDQVRQTIHRYKYYGDVALVRFLATAATEVWLARDLELPDCIVPVPLHWFKQFRRGYNQSALLAEAVGERLRVPVVGGLRRRRWTTSQAHLSLHDRQRNLQSAFAVKKSVDFGGRRVLLLDDVLTTGSTLKACTRRLTKAGARTVDILTIARG